MVLALGDVLGVAVPWVVLLVAYRVQEVWPLVEVLLVGVEDQQLGMVLEV